MRRVLFAVLLLCFKLTQSQTLGKKIEAAWSVFQQDPQMKYGIASITVLNAETGEVVFADKQNTGLAPASTLKTITSVTAFDLLGKDFRWETRLGHNGTVSNGVLKGDLIISGSGDPSLGSNRYEQTKAALVLNRWLSAVKQAGIQAIEGRIIADEQAFGTQSIPMGWIWQDIGNYYGAGASAASWRENEFGVYIKPGGAAGEPVTITGTSQKLDELKLVNEVRTGKAGSGDNVYAYSAPYSQLIYLRGTYAADLKKTIMLSVPDPAFQLARQLNDILSQAGIKVGIEATTSRRIALSGGGFLPSVITIDSYKSPSLSRIVYWLNQKSLNLYAENILRTMALKQGRNPGFAEGASLIKDHWKRKLGIDTNAISILDGSGLSPENRITTSAMASILQSAWKEEWFNSFHESLPLYNNMKMKSGSIRNVLAYSGYEKSADGTPLVFSFITNNYSGSTASVRRKMFTMLNALK